MPVLHSGGERFVAGKRRIGDRAGDPDGPHDFRQHIGGDVSGAQDRASAVPVERDDRRLDSDAAWTAVDYRVDPAVKIGEYVRRLGRRRRARSVRRRSRYRASGRFYKSARRGMFRAAHRNGVESARDGRVDLVGFPENDRQRTGHEPVGKTIIFVGNDGEVLRPVRLRHVNDQRVVRRTPLRLVYLFRRAREISRRPEAVDRFGGERDEPAAPYYIRGVRDRTV